MDFLSIPEEIYLLSINDEGKQHNNFRNEKFDIIIAAAILMDLALHNNIDSDLKYILPDKDIDTGDSLIDDVRHEIFEYGKNREIEAWITHLSLHGQFFRDEIITSLVRKGVLKIENEKLLWFFYKRKYPRKDDVELVEVQSRIRNLIFGEDLPDIRDIVIVSLLANSDLLETVFNSQEVEKYLTRINQIAKMDFIGQAIASLIKSYRLPPVLKTILKKKTAEEMLEEHIEGLKKKFKVKREDDLPLWIRKGTSQYEKTLEFVREKNTAEITFNPKTKKYSELNYSYYQHVFGSGA